MPRCCSDSDSDDDLPPLEELIARATPAKARRPGPSTSTTARLTSAVAPRPAVLAIDDSPETTRKHKQLAAELFPPSPPHTAAGVAVARGARLAFPRANAGPAEPSERVESDVEGDSSEDDLTAISNVFAKRPPPARIAPPPISASNRSPSKRASSKPRENTFITLSSDSDSSVTSDFGSDSASSMPSPPRRRLPKPKKQLAVSTPSRTPIVSTSVTPGVQVVPEAEEERSPVKVAPGAWPSFDDDDWNAGMLSYVPTPRKVTPLLSRTRPVPPRASENATPSTTANRASALTATMLDLTLSSDSDDEPHRPKSSLPLQPTTPSTPAARPRAIRKKAPVSAPAQSDNEARLTAAQRETLPAELIAQLNEAVFKREWRGLTRLPLEKGVGAGLPPGLEVRWSNTLRNTAGRATWKTVKRAGETVHECHIDLARKVTDTPSKLLHTLSHELCHIAAWVLSSEVKPSHGPAFKLWSARIMSVRPDISITTTHKYEIVYKWRWRCGVCSNIFGRHSNSIDETKVGCGCGGRLIRIDKEGGVMGPRTPAKKSGWHEFLAKSMPEVRRENPGMAQAEVMKAVAERWNKVKATGAPSPAASRVDSLGDVLVDEMNSLAV